MVGTRDPSSIVYGRDEGDYYYYAVNETVRVLIRVLIRVRVRVRVRVRALYFDLSAIRIFRMSHSTIAQHNIAQHSVVVVFL